MRKLYTFIVFIVTASLFVACDNKPHQTLYTIKVDSIVFKTTGINAIVRYMYFREDKVYQ